MKIFRTLSYLIIPTAGFILSACSAIPLEPQGQAVITSPNPPPADCKYVGQITSNQGNFFTGPWTSNKNLEQGSMNDLRNQAGKMGANYVQLIVNRAGNTGSISSDSYGTSGGFAQTNVTDMGNAYQCPSAALGQGQ
jgi:hypothetical protein